jgi:hypothetical protein
MQEECNKTSRIVCSKCNISNHIEHVNNFIEIEEIMESNGPFLKNYPKD